MDMTPQEAIEVLTSKHTSIGTTKCDGEEWKKLSPAIDRAVWALKELDIAKEAIRKLLCNEYGSSCQFCIQDNNENAMCRKVAGSGGWCCENAAWNGKSD